MIWCQRGGHVFATAMDNSEPATTGLRARVISTFYVASRTSNTLWVFTDYGVTWKVN